jgi:Flp pilus assembly protein TadD
VTLNVVPQSAPALQPKQDLQANDWQRWNDYGIGLFLQGDLKGAAAAFEKVTLIAPDNPDGFVNIGRCALQEGDIQRARTTLERALAISPKLARAQYFYARVMRSDGDYDGAASHLREVLAQYPKDRVALNDLGRVLFLQRKFAEAISVLQQVLAIDPEDLEAHYNSMLSYKGLGNEKMASEHEQRYRRFKADESAQAITGAYRQSHPEDNNERQAIHEHVSVALVLPKTAK